MVIRSLQLRNYRRFRSLDLEFPENIIGVIGRNGMGKTTIVEAIGWALYGTLTARRTDKREMRSQFAGETEACEAELVFACGGQEYRVVRRLKGKNATAEAALYRAGSGEPEAVQERGVNEYVEKLTGLDLNSFLVSVFARQKELDKLSELQPEERRKTINRLINIDRIDRARQRVRDDRNSKRNYKEGLEAGLRDRKVLAEELKRLQTVAAERHAQVKKAQEELARQEKSLAEAKSTFEELSRVRDRFQKLESEHRRLQERLKQLQDAEARQRKSIADIKASEKALAELRPRIQSYEEVKAAKEKLDDALLAYTKLMEKEKRREDLQRLLRDAEKRRSSLDAALSELQPAVKELNQVEKEISTLEQQIEATQRELRDIEGELTSLRDQLQKERRRREEIVKLGREAPCPICTRPLADHYDDVLRELSAEIERITAAGKDVRERKAEVESRLKHSQSLLEEQRKLHHTLLERRQRAEGLKEQIAEADKNRKSLRADLRKLNEEIARLGKVSYDVNAHEEIRQRFEELSRLREQALKHEENVRRLPDEEKNLQATLASLGDTNTLLGNLAAQLAGLGYDEKKWTEAKAAVDRVMEARDSAKDRLHHLQQAQVEIRKDVERVKSEITEQERLEADIKVLEEELHYYDLLEEHLGRFRLELAGRMRPLIAHRASELLRLTTNSRYSVLELDEDYNIFIYDGTERFALARFSGGEQDLANLCLRVAISQVVAERTGANPVNFIILDEIFGSQDEERKGLILHGLQQLSNQFRQMFVITHVEGIKDVLPVLISVEEVDGGESRARLV